MSKNTISMPFQKDRYGLLTEDELVNLSEEEFQKRMHEVKVALNVYEAVYDRTPKKIEKFIDIILKSSIKRKSGYKSKK